MPASFAAQSASAGQGRASGQVDAERKGKHKNKKRTKRNKKQRNNQGPAQDPVQDPGSNETCFDQNVTLRAVGATFVEGTAGDDVILGDAAGNKVIGNGGFDNICVGEGNDLVAGSLSGTGDDPMNVDGGAGDDSGAATWGSRHGAAVLGTDPAAAAVVGAGTQLGDQVQILWTESCPPLPLLTWRSNCLTFLLG